MAVVAAIASMIVGVVECDPGDESGEVKRVAIRIGDGTVLGKTNYGLWKADKPAASCRWTVTVQGKLAASGGPKDAVISGHGLKGGVLHARNCGWFYK